MHVPKPLSMFGLPVQSLLGVIVLLAGCGGGGDSVSPEDPFPDVGGSYNIEGGFDGATSNDASFVGSLSLSQASRQSGTLTGTMSVTLTLDGDVTTVDNVPLQSASVAPDGTVSFRLGTISSGATWTFTGTATGETISGRHTLIDGPSTFSGDWMASTGSVGTGSLTVTASTEGTALDPDGYDVTLDGAASGTLNGDNGVTLSGLSPGNHSVGLGGVANNCQVQGDNPRLVTISSGATASVSFSVVCTTPPVGAGDLRVTTTTLGPDPDPDGYVALLDGAQPGVSVPTTGSATFPNVSVGTHSVSLTGLAANCSVAGGSSTVTTTVSSGATSEVSFTIDCVSLPPTAGVLRIRTTTTGPDRDPDGYRFVVDGGDGQSIGVNAERDLVNTDAGVHTVVLSGVAANCSVDDASKTATVVPGGTATVAFNITCTALPPAVGSIRVTTSTTGQDPDPDGYQFAIDGGADHAIAVGASETVDNVPEGSHTVVLSGVAENCSVTGNASKTVSVVGGQTSQVAFSITCASTGPSASRSSVVVDPSSIPTGGTSTIRVTVRNASEEPVAGTSVTLSSTGSGNDISPASATTNASGVATFSFSSTVAGDKTITAKADGVTLNDTEVISVFARGSSTEITSVTPEPSTSGETIEVTVTVTGDGGGTPTGTVAIYSDVETGGCDAAPLNEGIATCEFALDVVDTHTIGATYSGDSQFEESSDPDGEEHEVVSASSVISGRLHR